MIRFHTCEDSTHANKKVESQLVTNYDIAQDKADKPEKYLYLVDWANKLNEWMLNLSPALSIHKSSQFAPGNISQLLELQLSFLCTIEVPFNVMRQTNHEKENKGKGKYLRFDTHF